METLSLTRFKSNMTAALSRVDNGQDVLLRSKKRLYKIVPVDDSDIPYELQKEISEAREEYKKGQCKTCHNLEELNAFLKSL